MYAKFYDLGVAAAIAIIAIGLALLGVNQPAVMIFFGLPLVLLLPGYAITEAALSRPAFGFPERFLYSLGISLVVVVLGGLLLNLLPWGLQAGSFGVFLGLVTLVASGMALLRRQKQIQAPPGRLAHGFNLREGLMLGAAAVIAIGALGVARIGAEQPSTTFTQLWMLPTTGQANPDTVQLGIDSVEKNTTKYKLQLQVGDNVVQEWPTIELEPGKKWETTAPLPAGQGANTNVKAVLYRLDDPQKIYRWVTLVPTAASK